MRRYAEGHCCHGVSVGKVSLSASLGSNLNGRIRRFLTGLVLIGDTEVSAATLVLEQASCGDPPHSLPRHVSSMSAASEITEIDYGIFAAVALSHRNPLLRPLLSSISRRKRSLSMQGMVLGCLGS